MTDGSTKSTPLCLAQQPRQRSRLGAIWPRVAKHNHTRQTLKHVQLSDSPLGALTIADTTVGVPVAGWYTLSDRAMNAMDAWTASDGKHIAKFLRDLRAVQAVSPFEKSRNQDIVAWLVERTRTPEQLRAAQHELALRRLIQLLGTVLHVLGLGFDTHARRSTEPQIATVDMPAWPAAPPVS